MEYADSGDLKTKLNKGKCYLPENEVLDYFTQICLALKHIHDRKILHRDLKSQNIFLSSGGLVKLGDFGVAKCLDYTLENANTFTGTPFYLSPEILQNQPYSFKSDIWSLGIVLYELCSLSLPFEASNFPSLALKISKGTYKEIPKMYSKELHYLVSMLLKTDHEKRPTINEIFKMSIINKRIKHFLKENEFDSEFSHTIIHKNNHLNVKMEGKNESNKKNRKEERVDKDKERRHSNIDERKYHKDKDQNQKIEKLPDIGKSGPDSESQSPVKVIQQRKNTSNESEPSINIIKVVGDIKNISPKK